MSPAHLLCSVDVHALVEMLLQVGHHGVVSRHPVDTCVFQTCRLHHATAHLHNQRDKLRKGEGMVEMEMVRERCRDEAENKG